MPNLQVLIYCLYMLVHPRASCFLSTALASGLSGLPGLLPPCLQKLLSQREAQTQNPLTNPTKSQNPQKPPKKSRFPRVVYLRWFPGLVFQWVKPKQNPNCPNSSNISSPTLQWPQAGEYPIESTEYITNPISAMICKNVEFPYLKSTATSNSRTEIPSISKPNCIIKVGCEFDDFSKVSSTHSSFRFRH